MAFKIRIAERVVMKPRDILDHPGQWREHNEYQATSLRSVLDEIGIADTIKAWRSERAGGKLVSWDGHLRKGLDPDAPWPVDILDITDAEADILLATHDPLTGLAGTDPGALNALLSSIETDSESLSQLLADLHEQLLGTPLLERDEIEEPKEDDFWPVITIKVPPDTFDLFNAVVGQDWQKLDRVLQAWDPQAE